MLDQNTDRMWYVIGAVIVGAALIFLMNGTFPTLFANIGETFEDKVGETTEMTDGIMPLKRNMIDMMDKGVERSTYLDIDTGELIRNGDTGKEHIVTGMMSVTPGHSYLFTSDKGNGVWYLRVVYYDEHQEYISGALHYEMDAQYQAIALKDIRVTAPATARYVRLSADVQEGGTTSGNRTGDIRYWRFSEVQ